MTGEDKKRPQVRPGRPSPGPRDRGVDLVVGGIAALILPGPGLLLLFAGLAVLSEQYEWAERRLEPVKVVAFKAAADSVQTWPRIIASCPGAIAIGAFGVHWCSSLTHRDGGPSATAGG